MDAGALRRAAAVSGRVGAGGGSRAAHRARACGGHARRRRRRPAGAGVADAPGRDGRRRRVRQFTAVRRAARVRRSACGVLRDAAVVRAPDAGTHHRRVGGRARPDGVPDGAGDARAAHPPREGDLEYLHGAGAAGQHGGDVRRVSRSRRAEGDRRPRARAGAGAGGGADSPRAAPDERALLRHLARPGAGGSGTRSRSARWRRASTSATSTSTTVGVALNETVDTSDLRDIVSGFFREACASATVRRPSGAPRTTTFPSASAGRARS